MFALTFPVFYLTIFESELTMKKSAWLFATAFAVSGLAFAQSGSGATESTDPAKIAAIEAHAKQLTGNGPQPMAEHEHMGRHHGMHHKRHMRSHKHHGMKGKKAAEAMPAEESKK